MSAINKKSMPNWLRKAIKKSEYKPPRKPKFIDWTEYNKTRTN